MRKSTESELLYDRIASLNVVENKKEEFFSSNKRCNIFWSISALKALMNYPKFMGYADIILKSMS